MSDYLQQRALSVEEAQAIVLKTAKLLDTEVVGIIDAVGRVAACDLISDCDIAPFDNSAMDGFAVRAADLTDASSENPVALRVTQEIPAGAVAERPVVAGESARIMTGAAMPEGADTVVMYELVDYGAGDGMQGSTIYFSKPFSLGDNVRRKGEEVAAGGTVIAQGEVIRAGGVGFMAGCGITKVEVYRRPVVGLISIGSELVPSTGELKAGCIRDSNAYALAACINQAGGVAKSYGILPDDKDLIIKTVQQAIVECDVLITTGGASNGDYDFIKPVIEELGSLEISKVAMRPGKAQTFGVIEGVPVLGLSGNPAAAYVGFELFARPLLRKMQGYTHLQRLTLKARLASPKRKSKGRRMYLRGYLSTDESGELIFTPAKNQSSGLFNALQQANCLAVIDESIEQNPVEAGTILSCLMLDISEDANFLEGSCSNLQ